MSSLPSIQPRRREDTGFSLREGNPNACIGRSRRFSASNLDSYREETRSFRFSANISSTASSPGYTPRALQARSGKGWDYLYSCRSLGSDGSALNPKWNEAEKYICNPLAGEVPVECLFAKTLSGSSYTAPSKITNSGHVVFSNARLVQMRPNLGELSPTSAYLLWRAFSSLIAEKEEAETRGKGMSTRHVGIQSTLSERSSSSSDSSPDTTTPIKESWIPSCDSVGSRNFNDQKRIGKGTEVQEKVKEEKARKDEKEDKDVDTGKCRFWVVSSGVRR
ncbi:uncharacterized protein [Aristolochia californica]|uniref:uncharacterized protein n=1 Tax=Aristolochia californica TaxID=171875 RepID=UPI0035DE3D5C